MEIFNNPSQEKNTTHAQTIKGVLIIVSLSIIGMLGIIICFYFLSGQKTEMLVMGISILPILAALELARINRTEASGTLLAFMLTFMVTVLATIGQGINDIGLMALPAILLIASLILRKEITISLTIFMIACCGWLAYGHIYGIYEPNLSRMTVTRFFVIATLILTVTSWTVQLISRMVIQNLQATRKDLREREKMEKELREAERLYRALVEETSVVVYRDAPDISGATIYISPQVESMLGYSVDDWKNNPVIWKSIIHPDDLPRVLNAIAGYIADGGPAQIEYRIQTKSGQWKWVRDESVVIKDEQGNFQYVHGVLIDITERKETEEKLKQREAILSAVAFAAQQLMKSSNWRDDIQVILARLGEATLASHVYIFENHPGEEGAALSSQKFEWVKQGVQSDLGNPVYQNTRLYPTPGMEDWYYSLSTGKPFYGSARQYPRYWERVFESRGLKTLLDMPIFVNGRWWGIIGFDDYVHEMPWSQAEINALVAAAGNLGTAIERQLTVDQLRISEEKFHLAFHHTYGAMAISRVSDNRLLDVNEAFCKITGFSREEAIGKRAGGDLNIWLNQEDQDFLFNTLDTKGFVDEYKSKFRRKNGEEGVGLVSALKIIVGGEACQLFSFYDISRIEQLLDELKSKNEELQSFTYTVSHDLKAPLVTISGFLGYLEQDARKGDQERLNKDILRINEAIVKMERLLTELLKLSRIGRITNPPEVVPFEEVVREALRLVEGRLKARQVQVQVEAGLPTVYGDRMRLVEVVQNLVDNAAQFMGETSNPMILIGVETRNGKNTFFVRDNGIGIKPEFHEKVFGLFNKLDANTQGTGIGLALVKRIIEVHSGRIWVESEFGKGSTFKFTLQDTPVING